MTRSGVNRLTLLVLVSIVSLIFGLMIQPYIITLILAGLFSALSQPIYRRFLRLTRNRKTAASALTLILIVLMVIIPLGIILSIVVAQAVQVGQAVGPWIQSTLTRADLLIDVLNDLAIGEYIVQYQDDILTALGNIVQNFSSLLVNSISQLTSGTVNVVFLFFIFLYSMFFFIQDGALLVNRILYYLPLEDDRERKLLDNFTSVSRATLKGTLLIGLIQGSMGAVGFWVVGIDAVVFWGLVMTVLSIVPLIGASLVWIPAVAVLAISGRFPAAIGLGLYCAILVGSIDNILRPILVGKDTKMHELLILLSTLGGIGLFGIWGVVLGPVIAALFVSVWDLYGKTFAEYLPEVVVAGPAIKDASEKERVEKQENHQDDTQEPGGNEALEEKTE